MTWTLCSRGRDPGLQSWRQFALGVHSIGELLKLGIEVGQTMMAKYNREGVVASVARLEYRPLQSGWRHCLDGLVGGVLRLRLSSASPVAESHKSSRSFR